MKYLPLLFLLAALAAGLWTANGGAVDGSVWVLIIALALFIIWTGTNRYRTGQWFTDSSGGH